MVFSRSTLVAALAALAACGGSSPKDPCKGSQLSVTLPVALPAARHATVQLPSNTLGAVGTVSYAWTLAAMPQGSAAVLTSPNSNQSSLTTDLPGVYLATLIARDQCSTSEVSTEITVADRAPVAAVGADQQVQPGATVTLDGSASNAPDGDPLNYRWRLLAAPAGSAATLSSTTAVKPTLVPDLFGTYVAELSVDDGFLRSTPVATVVHAGYGGPGIGCDPAPAPVARPGADQAIMYGGIVQVDGAQSTSARAAPLSYRWALSAVPAGSKTVLVAPDPKRSSVVFQPDELGLYVATLVVNDGCVDSAPASVKVTFSEQLPTPFIYGGYFPAPILVPLTLSTSVYSSVALTFKWQLQSAPTGSTASLSDPTQASLTFTPDLPGRYSLVVTVSDGVSSGTSAPVTLTVIDPVPQVGAAGDLGLFAGGTVSLATTGSSDASNRPLSFAWTLSSPAGSKASLSSTSSASPTFVADVPGLYLAKVTVTAGDQSASRTQSIAAWPTLTPLDHRVLDARYSNALDKLITASTDPVSQLVVIDPKSHTQTAVPLSQKPTSLSLSPDGKSAAVGHTGAVSLVDLVAAQVTKVLPVSSDVANLVLNDNGSVYLISKGSASDTVHLLVQPLAGGAGLPLTVALNGSGSGLLRPGASSLYVTSDSGIYYQGGVARYDLSGANPALAGASSSSTCGRLWLASDNARFFTRCGTLLRASGGPDDLTPLGALASTNSFLQLHHLADSAVAGEVAAITNVPGLSPYSTADDRALRVWTTDGQTQKQILVLPSSVNGSTTLSWAGRLVFYRSDGSERYLLLQNDPQANAALDFALVKF